MSNNINEQEVRLKKIYDLLYNWTFTDPEPKENEVIREEEVIASAVQGS